MTTILKALDDRRLLGSALRDPSTWRAWRAFLAALFGLGMTDSEAATYRECTGRATLPGQAFAEAWLVCGRRAGKSFVLALIAVFAAALRDYRPHLGPGERATIMVIAADRRQARVILRYVRGLLAIPTLSKLVENDTVDQIELAQCVAIEVGTASNRTIRGYTVAAALCDELAFWPQEESATPDAEILAALRPAMATIPNAMLICASSPYARRGALWDSYRRYHGKDDPAVLVWKAPTLTMNPTVPQRVIDEAIERDPASAASEYGAEFRNDIDSFVAREVVDAVTIPGRFELPPLGGHIYFAFCDPSGGSADSMTLAIAHLEHAVAVLDLLREVRPPFSPDEVCKNFAAELRRFGLSTVTGDRYAGAWPIERFGFHGIEYLPSAKPKSDLYREALPALMAGRVELLDNSRLASQLCGLERRTARGGRDSVDHPPGGHDDLANSACGALLLAAGDADDPMLIWRQLAAVTAYEEGTGPWPAHWPSQAAT